VNLSFCRVSDKTTQEVHRIMESIHNSKIRQEKKKSHLTSGIVIDKSEREPEVEQAVSIFDDVSDDDIFSDAGDYTPTETLPVPVKRKGDSYFSVCLFFSVEQFTRC
jgi:hypothetical protein